MATEYIKREDARTLLFDRLIETANSNTGYQCDSGVVYQDAAERLRLCWLDEVPTADVVERKHGKIITNEFGYESCSVCNYGLMLFITDENNVLRKPNYCPNCGAKMGIE